MGMYLSSSLTGTPPVHTSYQVREFVLVTTWSNKGDEGFSEKTIQIKGSPAYSDTLMYKLVGNFYKQYKIYPEMIKLTVYAVKDVKRNSPLMEYEVVNRTKLNQLDIQNTL